MSNMTILTPATLKPDQEVIDKLESALAKAKDGKLREVVIIGSYAAGEYFHNSSFENGPLLLGYLYMCVHSVASTMDNNSTPAD